MGTGETVVSVLGILATLTAGIVGLYFGQYIEKKKAQKKAIVNVYRKLLELKFCLPQSDDKYERFIEGMAISKRDEERRRLCDEITDMLWATEDFPEISRLLPLLEIDIKSRERLDELQSASKDLSSILEKLEKEIDKDYIEAAKSISKNKHLAYKNKTGERNRGESQSPMS